MIAVDPDFHGRGLGAQLTLAGLDHLAGEGIETGMLYVDADNTPAVTLYGGSASRSTRPTPRSSPTSLPPGATI